MFRVSRDRRTLTQEPDENHSMLGAKRDQDPRLCCSQPGCSHISQGYQLFYIKYLNFSQVFLTLPRLLFLLHWHLNLVPNLTLEQQSEKSVIHQLSAQMLALTRLHSFPLQSLLNTFQSIRTDYQE